ncbi:hypothetical protein ABK040_012999 [Willaertia magna]
MSEVSELQLEKLVEAAKKKLEALVPKFPLQEKHITRPPPQFIKSLTAALIKEKGYPEGLFDEAFLKKKEMTSEEKSTFLKQLLNVVGYTLRKNIPVSVSLLIKGKENTKNVCNFFQALAEAAGNKEKFEYKKAIEKVKSGNYRDVTRQEQASTNPNETNNTSNNDANNTTKNSQPTNPSTTSNNGPQNNNTTTTPPNNNILSNYLPPSSSKSQHRPPLTESNSSSNVRTTTPVTTEEKSLNNRVRAPSPSPSTINNNNNINNNNESNKREVPPSTPSNEEYRNEQPPLLQEDENNNGYSNNDTDLQSTLGDNVNYSRPYSSRAQSAKRGPPKIRTNVRNIDSQEMPTENKIEIKATEGVIVDDNTNEEEEEEHIMIVTETNLNKNNTPKVGDQAGQLVNKLMENESEIEKKRGKQVGTKQTTEVDNNQRKGIILNVTKKEKEKEANTTDLTTLRDTIQTLVAKTNPLGKTMDYIQEDLDSMQREMDMWRKEVEFQRQRLIEERLKTDQELQAAQAQFRELEQNIQDKLEKINSTKTSILANDKLLENLLRNVVSN